MARLGIPKGTRDFLPEQAAKRAYIFSKLRSVFEKHSFLPIETPSMENTETLMGKYGEEGDRLIFKILNSGDFLSKADKEALSKEDSNGMSQSISEKALRYDLTVPFARFVVQHQNELNFPFRRYQIQPVWRADRPQKGRYREFYQCDVDVIGSPSLLNELELCLMMKEGFSSLGLPDVTIHLNNRKILAGIAEKLNASEHLIDITVAIDKIDKIGKDKVLEELRKKEISEDIIAGIGPLLDNSGDNQSKLSSLKAFFGQHETGLTGIEEVEFILNNASKYGVDINFNITLARGLNYYTGAIFEVTHNDFPSSICGGGRYDDLTGIFGLKDISGVGISFGADRIYDLLEEKGLFPEDSLNKVELLFLNFGEKESLEAFRWVNELQKLGIQAIVYPDEAKLKKQFKYADDIGVTYVAFLGEQELEKGIVNLKDQKSGDQTEYSLSDLIKKMC